MTVTCKRIFSKITNTSCKLDVRTINLNHEKILLPVACNTAWNQQLRPKTKDQCYGSPKDQDHEWGDPFR